jgi:hypothetical protein
MIIKYELKRTRSHRVDMFPKNISHFHIWFCTDTCILLIPNKRLTWPCITNLVNYRSIYKIQNINTVHIVMVHPVVSHSVVVQSVHLLWRRSHTHVCKVSSSSWNWNRHQSCTANPHNDHSSNIWVWTVEYTEENVLIRN